MNIVIKVVRRFRLAVCSIAIGSSFESVSHRLHVIRKESGIAAYGKALDVSVSSYIRVVMAVCLQKLAELLEKVLVGSIAFDCTTYQGRS